jgi:hypothetical protein
MSRIEQLRFSQLKYGTEFFAAKPDEDWKPRTSMRYVKIEPISNHAGNFNAQIIDSDGQARGLVALPANFPVVAVTEWQRIKEVWRRNKQKRQQRRTTYHD